MKQDYINWLSSYQWAAFGTVTLKQAISTFDDKNKFYLKKINKDDVRATAEFFVKRLNKLTLASRAKMGEKISVLSFMEGDGSTKRYHLHFLIGLHPKVDYPRLEKKFYKASSVLQFGHNEVDIRQINSGESQRVVRYCFKEGHESLIPTASFLGSF